MKAPLASSSSDLRGERVRAIAAALQRAARARRRVLGSHSSARIIGALSQSARRWQDPAYAARRRLLEQLPRRVHLAPEMIERGLEHMFSAIDQDALCRLVSNEAGSVQRLDPSPPAAAGGQDPPRLLGPALVYYALAGNVPGLAIAPIVASALARSVCLIRDSARQPLLTRAFVDTLAACDEELAAMIVVDTWERGREMAVIDGLIAERAGRIELYGSDATVAELKESYSTQLPSATKIVTRATRISAGVITAGADPGQWAQAFAEDVVMYDGLGCLSPQLIIVEGSSDRAADFTRALARALDCYQQRWPRQYRDVGTEATRRGFIDAAEVAAAHEPGHAVLRGDADAWCIHLNPSARLLAGPGLRCVGVAASSGHDDTLARLSTPGVALAAVGLADGGGKLGDDYTRALQGCGATLVCSPGRMQAPPIDWHQDGLPRLVSLLEPQR